MSPHSHRIWLADPPNEGAWTVTLISYKAVSSPTQLQDATGILTQPESLASNQVQHQSTASNLTDCEAKPVALPTSRNNHWPCQISDHNLRPNPIVKLSLEPRLSMDSTERHHQAGEHNLNFHPARSYCRAQPATPTNLRIQPMVPPSHRTQASIHLNRGDCRAQLLDS